MSDKPGTFQPGDKRINRKGRPRTFQALRDLPLNIASEESGGMTRAELILRSWSLSDNPVLQMRFMEVAFGKVPDELQVKGKIKHDVKAVIKPVDYRIAIAPLAPGSMGDSVSPGEGENTLDGPQMG